MKDNKIFDFSRVGFQDIINIMTNKINECVDVVNDMLPSLDDLNKTSEQLENIIDYNVFYKKPKKGKKIVMIGDSTTDVAPAMYKRFSDYYTCKGGILEGANILNRGANGSLLYDRVRGNYVVHGWTMESDIAQQGDLYIICYGINDIKTGLRTKEQIREDLKTYIDNILTRTKANILLRIPNTFLSSENEEEAKKGWITPIEKAQEYSNQLWEIYESFRGYSNRLDIIDIPNLTIGRECKEYHPYMLDNVHGNDLFYIQVADEIAEWISGVKKRDFTDFYDFELILKGNIKSITDGIFEFNTSAYNELMVGDTVIIGNSESFVIENTPIRIDNGWRINTDHDFSSNQYGTVKILREKKKLITSVNANRNWINAFIENTNMSYGVRFTVDLAGYDLRDKETQQLINPQVDVSFDYEISDKSFKNVLVMCFFNNNPITVSDQAQQYIFPETNINYGVISGYSGSLKHGNITDKRYCHIIIANNLNDNVGLKNMNLSNLKFTVNGVNINLEKCQVHPYGQFTGKSYISKSNYNKNIIPVYSDIKDEINGVNATNDWVSVDIKTNGNSIYAETVIDLQKYGNYNQAMLFEIAMKYKTNSTQLTKFQPTLFFNNVAEHGNIVGGNSISAKEQTVMLNEVNNYDDIVYHGVSGFRYCHLIIEFKTTNGASGNVVDFGEIDLYIDNNRVDFSNLLFKAYNPLEGSKVINKLISPNSLIKYSDIINILKFYNLI